MNRKQKHLQGRRGEVFLELTRDVPPDQVICTAVDVHKYYHRVMLVNGRQEVLVPSFNVDTFQSGYDQLCAVIDETIARTQAKVLFIGMEPTGHYFENLARHLLDRYPNVRLVNSYAVSKNRDQKMLRNQKDDDIDLCSIADLILRNNCFPFQPLCQEYLRLQNWVRFHKAKVKARTALMNQIIGHLDRIFPGLVATQEDQPKLFADFWTNQTAQHLIRLCPNPRLLASMHPQELIQMFHAHQCRMGMVTACRIIDFAQRVLLPPADVIDARLPLLTLDLTLMDILEQVISQTQEQIASLLAKTPGQVLTQIKGIGVLWAASYIAGIGNPLCYEHAGQTFKRSGLISGRNDSGVHQRKGAGRHVTKVGDPHLRAALMQITHSLCQWQPYFGNYKTRLESRGKHPGVAAVATARKVNGVLFALMQTQSQFDPKDKRGQPVPPRKSVRNGKKQQPT